METSSTQYRKIFPKRSGTNGGSLKYQKDSGKAYIIAETVPNGWLYNLESKSWTIGTKSIAKTSLNYSALEFFNILGRLYRRCSKWCILNINGTHGSFLKCHIDTGTISGNKWIIGKFILSAIVRNAWIG